MKPVSAVSVAHAKQHFSDLLGRVAYGGEQIVIQRRGRPMVRLVPYHASPALPHLADAQGWLDDDDPFFGAMEEIVAARKKHPPRVLARRRRG